MPRNNSNNTLKQVAAFLLVIILLAVIGVGTWIGVVTNGFRDWSGFTGPSDPVEGGEQVSGVTDGDGNEMQSGESYALPASMVYAVPTAQSATASEGITVTATVQPETAANKNVSWYIGFAEQNEWSTGKTATDYVTVTPNEEDSRIATVVCEQEFGAQIVLTCTSEWDPAITATCTIDYAQSITDVSVKIGNVDVNLGGETEVSVDINNNDTDLGGVIAVEYTLSEVYTLAIDTNLTETLSFTQDGTDKDYFSQHYPSGTSASTYHCDTIEDAEGKTLYFDLRMFDAYNFSYTSANYATGDYTGTTTYFRDLDTTRIADLFDTTGYCRDKVLWTVQLSIVSEYQTITLESDIIWASIEGHTGVSGIELDPTEIIFSGAVNE